MLGPLGRTYGKGGLAELPAQPEEFDERQDWADTWPLTALGALLILACTLAMSAAGWLRP
jgi:hypothetical protein